MKEFSAQIGIFAQRVVLRGGLKPNLVRVGLALRRTPASRFHALELESIRWRPGTHPVLSTADNALIHFTDRCVWKPS